MSALVRARDFSGGVRRSSFGRKLTDIPRNLLNSSERKTLYSALKKRSGRGLTRRETQGAIRELIDNKKDNISRQEAIKLTKHLEETTGYKGLKWHGAMAQKYSRVDDRGKLISATNSSRPTIKASSILKKIQANTAKLTSMNNPKQTPSSINKNNAKTMNPTQTPTVPPPAPPAPPAPPVPKAPPAPQPPAPPAAPADDQKKDQEPEAVASLPTQTAPHAPLPPDKSGPARDDLFVVAIIVLDRQNNSAPLNAVLTKYGSLFLGRMGLPLSPKCTEGCSSVITLVAQGGQEKKKDLMDQLDALPNVTAKILDLPYFAPKQAAVDAARIGTVSPPPMPPSSSS